MRSSRGNMRRREFFGVLGGVATIWPLAARAQQAGKPTIGWLGESTPAGQREWVAAFVQRLNELGWTVGRNVAIEYRWAEGRNERFANLVDELVRLKVDIIVTQGTPAVIAAKRATSVIPVVFFNSGKSGCQRSGRLSGAARRQCHRPHQPDGRSRRQTNRTHTRNRPRSSPIGDHRQRRQSQCCAGRAGG